MHLTELSVLVGAYVFEVLAYPSVPPQTTLKTTTPHSPLTIGESIEA